jgi:tRNA(Ile)-lysidine synthase
MHLSTAEKLLQRFELICSHRFALNRQTKVVVGVSGGMDSMVLLFLLHRIQVPVVVAHVNYQLRENDSLLDEQTVVEFCKKEGIKHFVKRVPSHVWKDGNLQAIARDIRYDFYREVLEAEHASYIATAHHSGDHIETWMLQWLRGDYPLVPFGMNAQNGEVIRPLLEFSKQEIDWLADGFTVPWRMDASNLKSDYARNKVRNQILPLLREIQPGVDGMIERAHNSNVLIHDFIMSRLGAECNDHLQAQEDQILVKHSVLQDDGYDEMRLSYIALKLGWGYQEGAAWHALMSAIPGKRIVYKMGEVCKVREGLKIYYGSAEMEEEVEIEISDVAVPKHFSKNKDVVYLDKAKVTLPLEIRKWESGDAFHPLGMQGKKKVSDFLIGEKVELKDKSKVHVVTSGGEICWVVGMRIDERFKITEETEQAIQLRKK